MLQNNIELTKKKKGILIVCVYGRLLSISIMRAPIMMITTMIAMIPGMMYMSASDCGGAAVGAGVAAAASTAKLACAVEGQYPFVPAKDAKIVYLPVISGLYCKLNEPLESVVAVPTCL